MFKASASSTREHSIFNICLTTATASVVKPEPQVIVSNLFNSVSDKGNSAIAPVEVSGQPITKASGN